MPFGEDVLAAADADRHDRHAELHREVRGAVEQVAIVGPAARVPSGKIATGSPRVERGLERAQRGAVGGAALDLDRAERGEEPADRSGSSNSSSLARNRIVRLVTNAANGTSRIERCDGATMYAPDGGTLLVAHDRARGRSTLEQS